MTNKHFHTRLNCLIIQLVVPGNALLFMLLLQYKLTQQRNVGSHCKPMIQHMASIPSDRMQSMLNNRHIRYHALLITQKE